MPVMPRMSRKAQKIAYKVLGVPANMRKHKRVNRSKKVEQRLVFEETYRVK